VTPHKFKVGHKVALIHSRLYPTSRDRFEIVRVLPADQGNKQYRIRSMLDGHERVVTEGELRPADEPLGDLG
jgi:hypothetical protein